MRLYVQMRWNDYELTQIRALGSLVRVAANNLAKWRSTTKWGSGVKSIR